MEKIMVEYTVFPLAELTGKAREKALCTLSEFNTEFDWYQSVYDDATESADIVIEEFDIYHRTIGLKFLTSAEQTAQKILQNHGNTCDTYKLAHKFLHDLADIKQAFPGQFDDMGNPEEFAREEEISELEQDFLKSLRREYLSLLTQEYEYRSSEPALIELAEANEYLFHADGTIFNTKGTKK